MNISISVNGTGSYQGTFDGIGEQKGNRTVFAKNSPGTVQDVITQRRKLAQKNALKLVRDVWANDQSVDESILAQKQHYIQMEAKRGESQSALGRIHTQEKALREEYQVTDDSQEQQDLQLLKKRQDYFAGVGNEPSEDEWKRLNEIDQQPLTEYQTNALKLNGEAGVHKNLISDAEKQMRVDMENIKRIQLERLKSHAMVDANGAAEDIMEAANEEAISLMMVEVKDNIDETMDERKEEAKEAADKKEERQERLDALEEKQAAQEALIEGTKEAVERVKEKQQKHDAPNMELEELLTLTTDTKQMSQVQQRLNDIKNSMKLLEADLKGIQVDTEL